MDVRDERAVRVLLEAIRPDAVVHTAYVLDGPDLWATTAEGAGTVARETSRLGARLIHMSTDILFDGRRGRYTEDDQPSPITPYGEAKAAAERLVRSAHPGALIVRTSLLYGGREPSRHERLALDAADGRVEATFYTDELRSPVVVGDLAQALLELVPSDLSGVLNLGGADDVSRYELARLVVAASERSPDCLRGASGADTGRPLDCTLDSSRARSLVRTRLRGVREVLA